MSKNKIQKWSASLSYDDLILMSNALNEILNGSNAIEQSEFQTRTGIERDGAVQFQEKVNVLIKEISKNNH